MAAQTREPQLPFYSATLSVQPALCLNRRHQAAGCTRCVADCPVDALSLTDQGPVLDDTTCVRCGVCLQSCPTEVLSQSKAAERQLLEAIQPLPSQALAVVCALHETPGETAAPVAQIVQHRHCLAALGVEHLLSLCQDGERSVWLDDRPCATCPLGAVQERLQQHVASANALLQAFGRQASLILQSEQEELSATAPKRRALIDAGNPPVGRRRLLAALGRAVGAQYSEPDTATTESTNVGHPPSARLSQQVPSQRQTLRRRLQQWSVPPQNAIAVADLPYAAVTVDPARCSACGLCARFCPTGALQFSAEEDSFILSFQAAICIDCSICTVACPEDAVKLGDILLPEQLVNEEWLPLVTGQLTPCAQCGASTAAQTEEPTPARCYSCRQGAGAVQPLRDEAGLMADLLRRLPIPPHSP